MRLFLFPSLCVSDCALFLVRARLGRRWTGQTEATRRPGSLDQQGTSSSPLRRAPTHAPRPEKGVLPGRAPVGVAKRDERAD